MSQGPPQHANTRQYARARVDLYVNKITGDVPDLIRVRDLSVGGMYFYRLLEPERRAAAEFYIEMQLPGQDELIWATVEVVRREHLQDATIGYGVRFSRITEADKQLIERFVAQQPMEVTSHVERTN